MWALVPLKSPETAKSRLSTRLSPERRRDLFFSLARHVLTTCIESPALERVAVVTANAEVARFAEGLGALVIAEPRETGTAPAFVVGLAHLATLGISDVLMTAGDLPLLSGRAIDALVAARADGPGIVIAPDQSGTGTNALLCSPASAIPPSFGVNSFHLHVAAARARGLAVRIVEDPDLALDLDVEADLDHLHRLASAGRRVPAFDFAGAAA
jgi:2-phospho-L-lactate guanylyltransferase